jgi:GT2 family glycosyltransferase
MKILRLTSREEPLDCIASVVLYKNPQAMIQNVVRSFLDTSLNVKLYVIDNSPTPLHQAILEGTPVFYHHAGQNFGYGKAHNWCLSRCEPSRYYLILNPDVIMPRGVLEELIEYMDAHPDVGMISPRVLNQDQTLQYLNKRHPTLLDLFLRRFYSGAGVNYFQKRLDHYEMKDQGYDHLCEVPFMTGAFMFCRTAVLKKVDGFDPRFFMYFEDADLSRKIQAVGYKTLYYPFVHITHLWQRASQKRIKMTMVFILSGLKYFQKWGWRLY